MIFLCSDNESVTVEKSTIAHEGFGLLEDFARGEENASEPIPLPTVDSMVFKKVVEFCDYHKDDDAHTAQDIEEWNRQFINVNYETLFKIICVANFLNVKPLLDVGCRKVAGIIRGKTPAEIQAIFDIGNSIQ